MRECLDEGILQSFCDGELSREQAESVTSHLTHCSICSAAVGEMVNENDLLATALAPEFEAAVPTERLRHRIDSAIAGLGVVETPQKPSWFASLAELFTFRAPALAYASLVAVLLFATLFGLVYFRRSQSSSVSPKEQIAKVTPTPEKSPEPTPTSSPTEKGPPSSTNNGTPTVHKTRPRGAVSKVPNSEAVAKVRLLPGERSYLKTIAALDSTIKSNDRPMRPALRAEYERNLALVDRAIAVARNAAKKNRNDPDAAEFVFSAYQSKVDLLNTVADARVGNRQQ